MTGVTLDRLAAFRSGRAGDRARRGQLVIAGLALLLAGALLLSLASGPTGVGLADLWLYASGEGDRLPAGSRRILEAVRLPRTGLGLVAGAGLGLSGALMQGLFRNPLADPGIVGVTSGAALAAVAGIVYGGSWLAPLALLLGSHFLATLAFAGGLLNTALLYALATRGRQTSTATLVLAGIAVGALSAALTGLMIFGADDAALRDITFWSMGSLGGATGERVLAIAPFVALVLLAAPMLARALDALAFGDASAFHMGVRVEAVKRLTVIGVAAASGATVAVTGSIGFVGIVVPHLLRLLIGPTHRLLLPASALGGAALLLFADCLARSLVAPAELPVGLVTALIGAPVFLSLLLQRRGAGGEDA